jgi:hypothetical protein
VRKGFETILRIGIPALGIILLTGCAADQPPQPPEKWGGIGFLYEAEGVDGGKRYDRPVVAAHIGFEKQLGGGFGIGAEADGTAR